MKIIPKQVSVDFDGTLVMHDFPFIGNEVPDAARILRALYSAGHTLILSTMRYGNELLAAEKWVKDRDIHISYVNRNPMFETGSRKIYSHLHIDDHNLGTPLIFDRMIHHKPFVDWIACEKLLKEKGYL